MTTNTTNLIQKHVLTRALKIIEMKYQIYVQTYNQTYDEIEKYTEQDYQKVTIENEQT